MPDAICRYEIERASEPQRLLLRARSRPPEKNIVTKEFVKTNWAKGIDAKGQPIPNPAKEPKRDGALVSPNQAEL